MAALGPRPSEAIPDLGCGQGMMTEELARAVGPGGQNVGVDPAVLLLPICFPNMISGKQEVPSVI
jgi:arsenite methyltransferase